MTDNIKSAIRRLSKAETKEQLKKLDVSFFRIHEVQCITEKEYEKLCVMIMEKEAKL